MAIETAEEAMAAVKRSGWTLQDVPDSLKTEAVCLAAVLAPQDSRHAALQYVPEALRTPKLCHAAVRHWGAALEFVPEALKTSQLCREAVWRNGAALCWVPKEWRTRELCRTAVDALPVYGFVSALKFVPPLLKTPALCLEAVRKDGDAMRYVPGLLRPGIESWLEAGLKHPPRGLPKEPATALEAACDIFAECTSALGLPASCSLRLQAEPRHAKGFAAIKIKASDEAELVWSREEQLLALGIFKVESSLPSLPEVLLLFAGRLKRKKDGGIAARMPEQLRQGCIFALECAAQTAADALDRQRRNRDKERHPQDEDAGPSPH